MIEMGKLINTENDYSFVNSSMRYKVEQQLLPWERRNFLFWVVMDSSNFYKLSLIVQSIHIPNCQTFVFTGEDKVIEKALMNAIKQFRLSINPPNLNSLAFNDKNVILNRWWKNYLFRLPKQPMFINMVV